MRTLFEIARLVPIRHRHRYGACPVTASSERLAVVIATRDRAHLLRATVDAVVPRLRPGDELVVVDSASRDPSVVATIAAGAGVRSVRLDEAGSSRARNAGARATTAPLVSFIDDDCLVEDGWADAIAAPFTDASVGFVTGSTVADRHTRLPVSVVTGRPVQRFVGGEDPSTYGTGANVTFRRAAFDAVGGFDEHLGPGTSLRAAEDQDLLWRVVRAGWVGVHEPSAIVVHRQWRSGREALRTSFSYGVGAGALAVKAVHLGDPEGWPLLRARLWRDGVRLAATHLWRGYQMGAASCVLRAAGAFVGAVRAAPFSARDGHLRPRHHRPS